MARQGKVLDVQVLSDDLGSILGAKVKTEGEHALTWLSSDLHVHTHSHAHTHTILKK